MPQKRDDRKYTLQIGALFYTSSTTLNDAVSSKSSNSIRSFYDFCISSRFTFENRPESEEGGFVSKIKFPVLRQLLSCDGYL